MKYLLDTCVISESVKKTPEARVMEWLENCDEDLLYISVLTLGEIQKGIAKLSDSMRKQHIQKWLDADLRDRFEGRILPITEDIALSWGVIQGEAESKGAPIPTIDSLIGATALAYNLCVVTRNENDIQRTGAHVLNPWNF